MGATTSVATAVSAIAARATSVLPVPVGMMTWPRLPAARHAARASACSGRSTGRATFGQRTGGGEGTSSRHPAANRSPSTRRTAA